MDLSDRHLTDQEKLKLSQALSQTADWWHDLQTDEIYWSDQMFSLLAIDKQESLTEADINAIYISEHIEILEIAEPGSRQTHPDGQFSLCIRQTENEIRYLENRWQSHYNEHGHEILRVGCLMDVTKSRRAEGQFHNIEREYHSLIDNIQDCLYRTDIKGRLIFASPSIEQLMHCDPGEIIGDNLSDYYVDPGGRERLLQMLAASPDGKVDGFQTQVWRKDGVAIWLSANTHFIYDDEGQIKGVEGTLRDITAIKETESSLRKLSQAVEQAGESILVTDTTGVIEYVNPAFSILTGYSSKEAIGQSINLLKSGEQDRDFYQQMWQAIINGDTWHGKVVDKKKDGSFFTSALTISPIFDDSGNHTHNIGIHSDLTELEILERQFHQSQKMEAIGTLVGGIAHDFNNMLAGITGNLYLLKKMQENPRAVKKLETIEQLSFNAADMIQQLLTFARKDIVALKPVQLSAMIREAINFLTASIPKNIRLKLEITSDALPIVGDVTQLKQVLMNLINNARDAIEDVDDPCISIKLESFQPDDELITRHAYFNSERYAHLSIQDNGCGISEDQMEKLFDPFFTTKEQGKGTGLGLSMVYGAVKNHHGCVEVENTDAQGLCFHIYLPLQQLDLVVPARPQMHANTAGQGETLLLADDQPEVLAIAKEVLVSMGYNVLVAENGQLAVELYKTHAQEIDLCIFDVVMPIMGGDQAAVNIRQFDPAVKIIFATGYDKSLLKGMENEMVLTKPYAFEEMNNMIRTMLKN